MPPSPRRGAPAWRPFSVRCHARRRGCAVSLCSLPPSRKRATRARRAARTLPIAHLSKFPRPPPPSRLPPPPIPPPPSDASAAHRLCLPPFRRHLSSVAHPISPAAGIFSSRLRPHDALCGPCALALCPRHLHTQPLAHPLNSKNLCDAIPAWHGVGKSANDDKPARDQRRAAVSGGSPSQLNATSAACGAHGSAALSIVESLSHARRSLITPRRADAQGIRA